MTNEENNALLNKIVLQLKMGNYENKILRNISCILSISDKLKKSS